MHTSDRHNRLLRFILCVCAGLCGCEMPGSGGGGGGGGGSGNTAIIQYAVQDPDGIGVDADRLAGMIAEAAQNGARLVVSPETAFYRYSPYEQNGVTMVDLAATHAQIESRFAGLAAQLGIYLVIGFREPAGPASTYNTAVLFGPGGQRLARHRKAVPSKAELGYTTPGGGITVASTGIGRIGLAICKDVDDPGVAAAYAAAGLDLFLLPAGDPDGQNLSAIKGVCAAAACYGVLANQQIRKGDSAWVKPDGALDSIGGGEKIAYRDIPGVGGAP